MKYSYVIVDDEGHSRDNLRKLMKDHADFDLAGAASTRDEGRVLIAKTTPDLILLDVMLGDSNGFEMLTDTNIGNASVIFVTSHDAHALQAFKVSALDYLLKPVDSEEFARALDKFRDRKSSAKPDDALASQLRIARSYSVTELESAQIALPTLNGFSFVYVKDIVRCESDNTYTTFHFVNQKPIIVSRTLKEWETLLYGYRFFRVHNSHLINKRHIVEYKKGDGGLVVMSDRSHVDVSRRRKDEFLNFIATT